MAFSQFTEDLLHYPRFLLPTAKVGARAGPTASPRSGRPCGNAARSFQSQFRNPLILAPDLPPHPHLGRCRNRCPSVKSVALLMTVTRPFPSARIRVPSSNVSSARRAPQESPGEFPPAPTPCHAAPRRSSTLRPVLDPAMQPRRHPNPSTASRPASREFVFGPAAADYGFTFGVIGAPSVIHASAPEFVLQKKFSRCPQGLPSAPKRSRGKLSPENELRLPLRRPISPHPARFRAARAGHPRPTLELRPKSSESGFTAGLSFPGPIDSLGSISPHEWRHR
jgi:hypothetical protein